MPIDDTRDRVIALEVQVQHLTTIIEKQAEVLKDQADKITALYNMLFQAKGARWLIGAQLLLAASIPSFLLNWQSIMDWLFGKH